MWHFPSFSCVNFLFQASISADPVQKVVAGGDDDAFNEEIPADLLVEDPDFDVKPDPPTKPVRV